MFAFQTSFKPLMLGGGGGLMNSKEEDFCPNYFHEFGLWIGWSILHSRYILIHTCILERFFVTLYHVFKHQGSNLDNEILPTPLNLLWLPVQSLLDFLLYNIKLPPFCTLCRELIFENQVRKLACFLDFSPSLISLLNSLQPDCLRSVDWC